MKPLGYSKEQSGGGTSWVSPYQPEIRPTLLAVLGFSVERYRVGNPKQS